MEFEMLAGISELFESAEAEAAELSLGEAAAVEHAAAVAEMAAGPLIDESEGALTRIQNFIDNNPYGQTLWRFAKWSAKTTGEASLKWSITYGLNKAIAQKAHETGHRTSLSEYLDGLETSFIENALPWSAEAKSMVAKDALSFPWLDAQA
jgi:hypothetical protein